VNAFAVVMATTSDPMTIPRELLGKVQGGDRAAARERINRILDAMAAARETEKK